jgi:hypothetical protein
MAFAALALELARAEVDQHGNLIVALGGEIEPRLLPREGAAPAALTLSGYLKTADGAPLPHLRSIEFALASRGGIDSRGLPVCPLRLLRGARPETALSSCGDALVGHGQLEISVFLPNQPPFDFDATLRAFNGRRHDERLLWLHIYGAHPPSSFVLPVTRHKSHGLFPTSMRIAIPAAVGPWPHVAKFEFTLERRFSVKGDQRSFLNASCPLPPRFTAGLFPFARATYQLADGASIRTTIVRGCRSKPERRAGGR